MSVCVGESVSVCVGVFAFENVRLLACGAFARSCVWLCAYACIFKCACVHA